MYANFHQDYKVLPVFEIINEVKNKEKVQNDLNNETKSSLTDNETKTSETFEKSLINKLLQKNDEIKAL